jgi:hypothetical protein
MTNSQTRLIASAIGMLAGSILCTTDNVEINFGLAILFVSTVLFVVEFFRLQKP